MNNFFFLQFILFSIVWGHRCGWRSCRSTFYSMSPPFNSLNDDLNSDWLMWSSRHVYFWNILQQLLYFYSWLTFGSWGIRIVYCLKWEIFSPTGGGLLFFGKKQEVGRETDATLEVWEEDKRKSCGWLTPSKVCTSRGELSERSLTQFWPPTTMTQKERKSKSLSPLFSIFWSNAFLKFSYHQLWIRQRKEWEKRRGEVGIENHHKFLILCPPPHHYLLSFFSFPDTRDVHPLKTKSKGMNHEKIARRKVQLDSRFFDHQESERERKRERISCDKTRHEPLRGKIVFLLLCHVKILF